MTATGAGGGPPSVPRTFGRLPRSAPVADRCSRGVGAGRPSGVAALSPGRPPPPGPRAKPGQAPAPASLDARPIKGTPQTLVDAPRGTARRHISAATTNVAGSGEALAPVRRRD